MQLADIPHIRLRTPQEPAILDDCDGSDIQERRQLSHRAHNTISRRRKLATDRQRRQLSARLHSLLAGALQDPNGRFESREMGFGRRYGCGITTNVQSGAAPRCMLGSRYLICRAFRGVSTTCPPISSTRYAVAPTLPLTTSDTSVPMKWIAASSSMAYPCGNPSEMRLW